LKVEWRAFYKELRVRHGRLLYLITLMAGNLCLLTQLISSQGLQLLLAISWILVSKKICLVDLTNFLKDFQSSILLVVLYLFNTQLHSLFHYCLECFIILIHLAFFSHARLILNPNKLTRFSSLILSVRFEVSRVLMITEASLMNVTSSSLPFSIESLGKAMNSSAMGSVIR